MNKKIVIRNSIFSMLSQMFSMFFQFVTRSFFIKYLGVELLGISSTFSSLLNTLSLAELGFQTAIVYGLYKPLNEGNNDEINRLINVFRFIYRCIGCFFVIGSFAMMPFLAFVLKGISITSYIYIIFFLQTMTSACTYFLAYKRTILYADQKEYISKSIDMILNTFCNILQIIVIVFLKNYIIYLIIKLVQTYSSNLIVHLICKKKYPYLKSGKAEIETIKSIFNNVKDVFIAKIASYVYSSTDSLIISAIIGVASVGYLVNYTTITNNLKTLISSILNPVTPTIGNMLAKCSKSEDKERVFLVYTYIRYFISLVILVPTYVLIDDFIKMWVGDEYMLPDIIVFLLILDLFIHIVHSSCCDFINGSGLFKYDKYIEMIGTILNIFISIIGAHKLGIEGVLWGTVIAQCCFWIGRSAVVYKFCFNVSIKHFVTYWINNIFYIFGLFVCISISKFLHNSISINTIIIKFIISGVLIECVVVILFLIMFSKMKQFSELKKMFIKHK